MRTGREYSGIINNLGDKLEYKCKVCGKTKKERGVAGCRCRVKI